MKHRPLSLSKAFNDLSHYPARRFELSNNLRNIAGHYKIPNGMTADAYEKRIRKKLDKEVNLEAQRKNITGGFRIVLKMMKSPKFHLDSWHKLVRLNPVLTDVQIDKENAMDLFNAHFGVTSGFNIDDINFYIAQEHRGVLPAQDARAMPDHGERLKRIEAVSKTSVNWVMSPKTARKVENRLKRHKIL